MSQLGLGVMINMLGGNDETAAAIMGSVGRKIRNLELITTEKNWRDSEQLVVTFEDDTILRLWDDGQSCCESRYITTDDNLDAHVGTEFRGAEVRDGPEVEAEYEVHETQFLLVHTTNGTITLETHNEHNGYYGGFWIRAELDSEKN